VSPILGEISSRPFANGQIMSCDSDEYKEIMKLFHLTAEEYDVNFSRFSSRKTSHYYRSMACLPRALDRKSGCPFGQVNSFSRTLWQLKGSWRRSRGSDFDFL
jgi:hypothetical protein